MSRPRQQILAELADSVEYLNIKIYAINHAKSLCRDITNRASLVPNIIRRVEEKKLTLNQTTDNELESLLKALIEEKNLFGSIIEIQGSKNPLKWLCNEKEIEKKLINSFIHMQNCIKNLNETLDLSDAKQSERNFFFPIVREEDHFPKHEDATKKVEDPIGNGEEKSMPDQPDPPTLNNVEAQTLRKLCANNPELQMVFPRDDYAQAIELALDLQEFYYCYETLYLREFKSWYLFAETHSSEETKFRRTLAAAKQGLAKFLELKLDEKFPENVDIKQTNIQNIENLLAKHEEKQADLRVFLEKRGTLEEFKTAMRLKRDGIMDKVSNMGLNQLDVKIFNDNIPQLELCCVYDKDDHRGYLTIARYDSLKSILTNHVFRIISERRSACDLKSMSDDLQSIRTELAAINQVSFLNNQELLINLMQIAMENCRNEGLDSKTLKDF